jgi:crotonobetainyl-CoA:carnitine CoA-transferase CaiB-like acyl-CoA transferase
MTGDPDRPPARVALATTDYLTAVYGAFGAMTAIHERQRSGRGQVVDVALYETAFTQMESYVPAFEKTGFIPARVGPNLPTMAPNSLYPTADGGWILIAANSNAIYARLAALMGQPEVLLLDEPSLGLAPQIIEKIFEIITDINKTGMTIVLVEQNALQALQIAHYGIVLETGKIKTQGDARQLLRSDEIRKAYLGD